MLKLAKQSGELPTTTSLYASYVHERLGKHVVERPEGFATYYFLQDGVYIEDIFVLPEHRHSHVASSIADEIQTIARDKGFKKAYGSLKPSAHHSTESLKVLLAYGFRLLESGPDAIFMVKDI